MEPDSNGNNNDNDNDFNTRTPLLTPHVEIPGYGVVVATPRLYQNIDTPNNEYNLMNHENQSYLPNIQPPPIISPNNYATPSTNSIFGDSGDLSISSDIKKDVARAEVIRDIGFFKKVYILLTMQILSTVIIAGLSCKIYWDGINLGEHMWEAVWPEIISAIFGISTLIALLFLSDRYPWNYVLLAAFTFSWSIFIGCISGPVAGDGSVTASFMIVLIVFIGLTILTFIEKVRKKIWIFCLAALGFCIIGSIITYYMWFFAIIGLDSKTMNFSYIVYCALFAGIFSCYMVIDTLAVRHNAKFNNYIYSCARLYADIVYMFVFLISMLGGKKG